MALPVQFYSQLQFGTVKIQYILTHRKLPAESHSIDLSVFQYQPKSRFVFCPVGTKLFPLDLFLLSVERDCSEIKGFWSKCLIGIICFFCLCNFFNFSVVLTPSPCGHSPYIFAAQNTPQCCGTRQRRRGEVSNVN